MGQSKDNAFAKLNKSKFRSSFHLSNKDFKYIDDKGIDTIRSHCKDFIKQRLTPAYIPNDGRQTPMRGHPVFIAQHACACCCRGCLEKWYRVPQGQELTVNQQERIVAFLMSWIAKEVEDNKEHHKRK